MSLALGFAVHSGWAALVVAGERGGETWVLERRRIELIEEAWGKFPYHGAQQLGGEDGRAQVKRVSAAARRLALEEVLAAVERVREAGHPVVACGVLVGEPMPAWSLEEIIAVHPRMHRAEGALFRQVLLDAGEAAGLATLAIPQKRLLCEAEAILGRSAAELDVGLNGLRKALGAPWGKDQKGATLAALMASRGMTKLTRGRKR